MSLPATAGPALATLLAGRSAPVGVTAAAMAWGGWTIGLVATLVPHPLSLTALRFAATAALLLGGAAAVDSGLGELAVWVALAAAVAVVVLVNTAANVDAMADGASYGPERRAALRVPAPLLFGPLPLALAAPVVAVVVSALAWAAGRIAVAVVATVLAAPIAVLGVRAVHRLSRRWLVFVPAGVVLHDHLVLSDPVLVARANMAAFGPALRTSTATDLSAQAPGLVLQLDLVDGVEVGVRQSRRRWDTVVLHDLLVSPVSPGAVLRLAERNDLPVAR